MLRIEHEEEKFVVAVVRSSLSPALMVSQASSQTL
jgi:hypothetical protein